MPQEKIEHFLDFLFTRGLLQDVAYGVNKIKFDNGDEQKVANSILTMKYSHTTEFYKEICRETDYVPMADTSLWRILHGINPSQGKALAGLDDVRAAGMNGFKVLADIADQKKCKDISKSLEKGKHYLKSNYPVSCSEVSTLRSHSTQFALCFEDDADLNQTYSQVNEEEDCVDCVDLLSTLNQICDLVNQSNDGDLQYDTNVTIDDVKAYMKHQKLRRRAAKIS